MSCVVYKNNCGYDKSGNDVPYTLNGGTVDEVCDGIISLQSAGP